jgi:alkylated DNA repair dioxygenase AlkB
MNTLFPLEDNTPPGFKYIPEFITPKEENGLISVIEKMDLKNMIFQGFEAKRKVASFGFDWSFDKRQLTRGKPIPDEFGWLIGKVANQLQIVRDDIAELLITEYPPGSVINWHRDAPPFDIIVGVSLLSNCIFKFRPYDKTKQTRKNIRSLAVERRSLYVIQGESRTAWEHSVAPVKQQRYSITIRTLLKRT